MRAADLIRHKRDGGTLDDASIRHFVAGVTDGSWPDYQVAAMLMAITIRGMTIDEASGLTEAMVRSGERLSWPIARDTPVDKHSTGGVGDKASLVLAPLAAACGARVPMMSGRGLGHTGGTLDKLEAIPGFRTALSVDEMRHVLETTGCVLMGQTAEVAPADRRLYALRDVTATVESLPLICASILSKKIAEGIGALVIDVKVGSGAFMKTRDDAARLAAWLVALAARQGVVTEAYLTPMDAPLGRTVGNALEVIEAIETLKGRGPADLEALSLRLAAAMIRLAGLAASDDAALARVREALASGAALDRFRAIVAAHGGDPGVVDDYDRLPRARATATVPAAASGVVTGLDAWRLGCASVAIGAGRDRVDDTVSAGAGIEILAPVGTVVRAGDAVLRVHYDDAARLPRAGTLAADAIAIGPEARPLPGVVLEVVTAAEAAALTGA